MYNLVKPDGAIPPGAAGVLLNRSHQFHDLIFMLNAKEKSIFERIDGRRSIAELVAGDNTFDAQSFFQKLWFCGQVIFDTSKISYLCGALRISALSALKGHLNAENAKIRRGSQRWPHW